MEYGNNISASQDEKYDFVLKIAQATYRYENIVDWLKKKVK